MRRKYWILIICCCTITYLVFIFYLHSNSASPQESNGHDLEDLKHELVDIERALKLLREDPKHVDHPFVKNVIGNSTLLDKIMTKVESNSQSLMQSYISLQSTLKPDISLQSPEKSIKEARADFSVPRKYLESIQPSVLVVCGTDGSGTRRVVQLLTDLGTTMVSEDPETYDIHADLMGGWPPVVQPVVQHARSLGYDPDSFPENIRTSTANNLNRLLAQAERDSTKPTSYKLAVGGALPKNPSATARYVKYGFKAPVAMTLVPWWCKLIPHVKILHIVRDGRDIAFSANQGPVEKFYTAMYGKENRNTFKHSRQQSMAIRLWSDWNAEMKHWMEAKTRESDSNAAERTVSYLSLHIEDIVSDDMDTRFGAMVQLADWIGSDMDLDSMCCLAVRGSLFMGSHDRQGKVGVGGEEMIASRFGKWRGHVQNNLEMQQELEKFGNRGLDVFGYLDESKHSQEVQSYKVEGDYKCTYTKAQCESRGKDKSNWKDTVSPSVTSAANSAFSSDNVNDKCALIDGTDFRGGGGDLYAENAKDVTACCRLCVDASKCLFFSFDMPNRLCYLKMSKGVVVKDSSSSFVVSGEVSK